MRFVGSGPDSPVKANTVIGEAVWKATETWLTDKDKGYGWLYAEYRRIGLDEAEAFSTMDAALGTTLVAYNLGGVSFG